MPFTDWPAGTHEFCLNASYHVSYHEHHAREYTRYSTENAIAVIFPRVARIQFAFYGSVKRMSVRTSKTHTSAL